MNIATLPEREPGTAASYTDEVNRFIEFITTAFSRPGSIDSFCARIDQILEKANASRR
jgi:hypothetical protein